MESGFQFIDILIFAMIAGFLVYRLRSVLGRRNGEERRRPNPYVARPKPPRDARPGEGDTVVPFRDRPPVTEPGPLGAQPGDALAAGLTQIKVADPAFDERPFAEGVRAAFKMIVLAFARGDTATLRPLLGDETYDNFAAAIRDRTAQQRTFETRLKAIKAVDLLEARMDGRTAFVTAKIVSDQVNVTRDASGAVVDGDPDEAVEAIDIWTFARNTRSSDPNWVLVETRTPS